MQAALDRLSKRLGFVYMQFATSGRSGWGDNELEAQLAAFLEAALPLAGGAQAPREADLSEGS